ncbi:hypothetical protein BH11PSE3_BH11PSE3_10460 [soil metagenome]
MRIPTLLLALAFACASPAIAQAPKPVDAAALAQAKVFLEKSGSAALGQQMATAILNAQRVTLEQANPGRTAEINEVLGLMQAEFAKQLPPMVDAIAGVYAQHFSTEELAQITAFYDTPVGHKLVKEMPQILAETVAVAQTFGQKIAAEVIRALTPELEKRKLKLNPSKT